MRVTKILAMILIICLTLNVIIPVCASQSNDLNNIAEDNLSLLDKLILIRYNIGREIFGSPFYVIRFIEPEPFIADPKVISLEYLNQTEIIIGVRDENTTGGYKSLQDDSFKYNNNFLGHDYECHLEMPDYIPEDAFIAHFDPQLIIAGEEGELKTNLRITSNIPKDAVLPQNIELRINISKYTTFGNLYFPGNPGLVLGLLRNIKNGNEPKLGSLRIPWFLSATGITMPTNPFGRLFSGKRLLEYSAYVDIVVRLDRFHLANIVPQDGLQIGPDQIMSIPIEVQNLGSHVDCFNFRVSSDTDVDLIVSPPPAITLGPNEVGYTSIGVASPRTFLDPGTAHSINIEAYSIYDPETIFSNTATLITRGVYVSELNQIFSAIIAILVLFGVAIIYYRRQKILEKTCKKPQKPWTIPVEKRHLEELKRKDKEAYEKERLMMEDEYKSAILWYKDHLESVKKEQNQKSKEKKEKPIKKQKDKTENAITKFFSKSEKKEKPVKKVEKPKKEKEEKVQETQDIVKEPDKNIQKKSEEMKRRKEKALLKIKRAQEKQKKKIKK